MTGDKSGAIEDFKAYVASLKKQDDEDNQEDIAQREERIAELVSALRVGG